MSRSNMNHDLDLHLKCVRPTKPLPKEESKTVKVNLHDKEIKVPLELEYVRPERPLPKERDLTSDIEFLKSIGAEPNTENLLRLMGKDDYYRIKTTGALTEFSSGAVRDSAVGKARMELLPMDLLKRVAVWYGLGAEKYGDNNWRKGQAKSHVMGSLMRHLTAYQMGKTDEDHLSAVIWNALCLMNTDEYLSDNKEINNTEWFTDGIPNGKGAK